jgi:flavin reductase (DIM6/NTAB) family NADH-FMN oxidoreductase RutF
MESRSAFDAIDAALRMLDREVWVITAGDAHRRSGLVATWVAPASIDRERPVLLAALGANHFTTELVENSKAFAAHLLRTDQIDLAWNLARDSGRSRDKLAGLIVQQRASGCLVLADCLAWFECRVFARYQAGDRVFYWADVIDGSGPDPGCPKTAFLRQPLREHEFFQKLTEQQRQVLIEARKADAAANRPLNDIWRSKNPC